MTVGDLKKYKENLYSSLSRDLSEFEKNFLLISGGILAFSITFIKEIVTIDMACCLWLVFTSWGLIIFSIGTMMLTFLKSSLASDELWSLVDDYLISNNLHKDETELLDTQVKAIKHDVNLVFYKNKKILKVLRFTSVGSFITGIIFLAFYVSINMYTKNVIKCNGKSNSITTDSLIIHTNNFKKATIIYENNNQSGFTKTSGSKTDTTTEAETNTTAAQTKTDPKTLPTTASSPNPKTR